MAGRLTDCVVAVRLGLKVVGIEKNLAAFTAAAKWVEEQDHQPNQQEQCVDPKCEI